MSSPLVLFAHQQIWCFLQTFPQSKAFVARLIVTVVLFWLHEKRVGTKGENPGGSQAAVDRIYDLGAVGRFSNGEPGELWTGTKGSMHRAGNKDLCLKQSAERPGELYSGRRQYTMLVIGLTGGIGSGKSTVSKMFQGVGVPVICADDLARKVVEPGSPALEEIREVFGEEVIDREGKLDRAAMARVVFADASRRKKLEAIIHPRVKEEKDRLVEQLEQEGHLIAIVDVPLLLETGWQDSFDMIILVYVPREIQEKRLICRDNISVEEARSRLNAQMCIEEKRDLADRVIDNRGSVDETRKQVGQIFEDLKIMAANKKSARA
mgnify:FL=1